MAYCDNCGTAYQPPRNYCRSCGQNLAAGTTVGTVRVSNLSEGVASGVEQAHWNARRRQHTIDASNDSLELYIKFVAIIAIIHGLAYMAGDVTLRLLNGNLGLVLYGGVIVGAFLKMIIDVRLGYSLGRSLLEVVLIGVIAYGMVFGVFWWLTENYIHAGKPLFDFSSFKVSPTPSVLP